MHKLVPIVIAAAIVAGTAPPQAQTSPNPHAGHGSHAGAMDPASTRDFKAAHETMMKSMSAPYTGDADVDFRRQMIPHHQGAVDMAKAALRHSADPATRAFAQTIIDAQEREISEMTTWLAQKGR